MDRSNVEDIFRLSEPQEALLLHSLQSAGDDAGFLQLRGTLIGDLRLGVFEQAWQRTIARHPILRSSVQWKDLKHPVQVVARQAPFAVEHRDWRGRSDAERCTSIDRLLEEDRRRGLDITRAPVMRLVVLREAEDRHELLWTCHHILLDGWSGGIVLREVFDWYEALCEGREPALAPVKSFRSYITWLRTTDNAAAEQYWRGCLGGAHMDSCLAGGTAARDARPRGARATVSISLAAPAIEEWARTNRITLSSVLFGCWGLLLHTRTGTERPVFGVTHSGRSAAIEGVDSIVGMFANTLPLALHVGASQATAAWFREVLRYQQEVQRFEHCSLGQVLKWGGVPLQRPTFDTLVTHASDIARGEPSGASDESAQVRPRLRLQAFRGDVTSTFPLTLVIKPERELRVELTFDAERFERDAVESILRQFANLIEATVSGQTGTIAELVARGSAGLEPGPLARLERRRGLEASPTTSNERESLEPPATVAEAQLMRIFDDLIDIKQIGRHDNFFELGGHSLLLPRLIDRIERDFGVTIPLGVIFESPTVSGLAGVIESRNPNPSWQSLVGIREGGSRPPLYLVHGLGGEIGYFYNIAGYLHPDQPLYGLQPPVEPFSRLEPMAAHYLDEIRRRQPDGPYLLGGYCLGGCVAYEMARQLVASGEPVWLLAIIDSASPGSRPGTPRLGRRLRRLASKGPREILRRLGSRVSRPAGRPKAGAQESHGEGLPRWYGVPRAFHGVATRHFHAVRDYVPLPYDGDVWLFRSEDDRFEHDLGWGRLVRGHLRIEMVPGRHSNVLKEPHIGETARRVAAAVEAAATRAPMRRPAAPE